MTTAATTGPTSTTPTAPPLKRARKSPWRGLVTPLIVLIVVAIACFFGYQRIQGARAAATAGVQTRAVSRGNLSATVAAAGNLTPAAQVNLNFSSGGIIKEILVKEGDHVKAGQPLLKLQDDELALAAATSESSLKNAQLKLEQAKAGPKETDLVSAQAKIDSAKAGLDKLKQGPTAADIADAQAKITSAQANLAKVKAGPSDTDIANARQKIEQAKNSLWAAQSSRDATCGRTAKSDDKSSCNSANASVNNGEIAVQTAQNDLEKLLAGPDQNDVVSAQQNVVQAQNALAKLRQGPTAADITQAQTGITQAQASYDALTAGPDNVTIQLAQTAVDQAEVSLKQAQLKLRQATIFAPFDGVITAMPVVVGQNIAGTGNPVQIADLNTLQVVTNVSELDRSRLKVGQEVQMTLEALPGVNVNGVVASISPAGVTTQGVVNFPVTIKLVNPDPAVAPGMTANLNVIIEHKDDVLLVPNRAITTQGRNRTVTVLYEGQQIPVPVQVGMTDGTNTEITGGSLKEGDQVVMASTTAARVGGPGGFGGPGGGGPPPGIGR